MIVLENILVGNWKIEHFRLDAGQIGVLRSEGDEQQTQIIDVILGLRAPSCGTVLLFKKDLYRQSERERLKLLAKVGLIPSDGGFISNLSTTENLMLPALYHLRLPARDCEPRMSEALRIIDLNDEETLHLFSSRPDRLTLFERRLIGLLRLILLEPLLCLYEALFEDLDECSASKLAVLARHFHCRTPERATLFASREVPLLCNWEAPAGKVVMEWKRKDGP